MNNYYPYVDDKDFIKEVEKVLNKSKQAYLNIDDDFHKNVIDPFSACLDVAYKNIDYQTWLEQEKHRQIQKTLQNAIGYFHQNILGSVQGWESLSVGQGYDLISRDNKIFAEIKNKWNSTNSDSKKSVYQKMNQLLKTDLKGYTGYFVNIIPKNNQRFKKPFTLSVNDKSTVGLFHIDGASFYELVTGDKEGLRKLFESVIKFLNQRQLIKESDIRHFNELFVLAFGN